CLDDADDHFGAGGKDDDVGPVLLDGVAVALVDEQFAGGAEDGVASGDVTKAVKKGHAKLCLASIAVCRDRVRGTCGELWQGGRVQSRGGAVLLPMREAPVGECMPQDDPKRATSESE